MIKPQRFRRLPFDVEAIQYTGGGDNFEEVDDFSNGRLYANGETGEVTIEVREGTFVPVGVGDWIIRGPDGEFYPCPHGVFEESYEPLTTPF